MKTLYQFLDKGLEYDIIIINKGYRKGIIKMKNNTIHTYKSAFEAGCKFVVLAKHERFGEYKPANYFVNKSDAFRLMYDIKSKGQFARVAEVNFLVLR